MQFCATLFFAVILSLTESQSGASPIRLTSTLKAVEESGSVTLTCYSSSPADVIWIHNNQRLDVKANVFRTRNYSYPYRQKLTILRFTKSQNGTYCCQIDKAKSNKFTVFLTGKPILNVTNPYISASEGSSILVNVSVKNYRAGYLRFSLVNKFDNETVPGSIKTFWNIFTDRTVALPIFNISPRFEDRIYVKVRSLLIDTTEKGVYKTPLLLSVERKLPLPRLSVTVGQLSATLHLSLPLINPKYYYDSVKELRIETVKTGKLISNNFSSMFVSADVKQLKIDSLEPGESYTSFVTAYGENTKSDTSSITFKTNCFGKETPLFFFDIKTNRIFMNNSGLALPVTLHPDSELPSDLNLDIAGLDVMDNFNYSLAYCVQIDWIASQKNQSLILNTNFCPKIVINSSQFLNYSELTRSNHYFGMKDPTTEKPTGDESQAPNPNFSSSSNSTAADGLSKTNKIIIGSCSAVVIFLILSSVIAFSIKRLRNKQKEILPTVLATSEITQLEALGRFQTHSGLKSEEENKADESIDFSQNPKDNTTAVQIHSETRENTRLHFERKMKQENLGFQDDLDDLKDVVAHLEKDGVQINKRLEKIEDFVGDDPSSQRELTNVASTEEIKIKESSKMGSGSYGTVYRGSLGPFRLPVAVKVVQEDNDKAIKELKAMFKILETTGNRHVVKVLKFEKRRIGQLAIAMELCLEDLSECVQRNSFSVHGITELEVIKDIADGLNYLHTTHEIIHGDIKPQNILLYKFSNGVIAKIGDFGLSRVIKSNRASASASGKRGFGTKGWIAPEVKKEKKLTIAADVFPFGCVLYYILTHGQHPYDDNDDKSSVIDEKELEKAQKKIKLSPENYKLAFLEKKVEQAYCYLKPEEKGERISKEYVICRGNPAAAIELIKAMLKPRERRISTCCILKHHFLLPFKKQTDLFRRLGGHQFFVNPTEEPTTNKLAKMLPTEKEDLRKRNEDSQKLLGWVKDYPVSVTGHGLLQAFQNFDPKNTRLIEALEKRLSNKKKKTANKARAGKGNLRQSDSRRKAKRLSGEKETSEEKEEGEGVQAFSGVCDVDDSRRSTEKIDDKAVLLKFLGDLIRHCGDFHNKWMKDFFVNDEELPISIALIFPRFLPFCAEVLNHFGNEPWNFGSFWCEDHLPKPSLPSGL